MGEHTVPPGPAGNPGPATLGQQDPTTRKHGHGLVCEAAFRARGGSGQEARQGLVGPIHFIQGIFPEKADILLQNQIACSVLGCSLEPCPQLRQHPEGTSRSLGTSSPMPGPPCPTVLLTGISKAHAAAVPPPSP